MFPSSPTASPLFAVLPLMVLLVMLDSRTVCSSCHMPSLFYTSRLESNDKARVRVGKHLYLVASADNCEAVTSGSLG